MNIWAKFHVTLTAYAVRLKFHFTLTASTNTIWFAAIVVSRGFYQAFTNWEVELHIVRGQYVSPTCNIADRSHELNNVPWVHNTTL